MKKLQKTFIIFTFIFLLVLSLTCNVYANDTIYAKTSTAKAGDTVYFEKPDNWGTGVPYIYAWDNYTNPQNKLGGNWPGVTMTLIENNLYSYTFENDIKYTQLIFTSTDKSKQTKNLDYICNGYIYKADSTAENLSYSSISLKNSLKKDNTVDTLCSPSINSHFPSGFVATKIDGKGIPNNIDSIKSDCLCSSHRKAL